jgi:hypothetical protein
MNGRLGKHALRKLWPNEGRKEKGGYSEDGSLYEVVEQSCSRKQTRSEAKSSHRFLRLIWELLLTSWNKGKKNSKYQQAGGQARSEARAVAMATARPAS